MIQHQLKSKRSYALFPTRVVFRSQRLGRGVDVAGDGQFVGVGHRRNPLVRYQSRSGAPGGNQGRYGRASSTQRATAGSASNSARRAARRSEEHTSELQSLMRTSYAVFCLKKKKKNKTLSETSK